MKNKPVTVGGKKLALSNLEKVVSRNGIHVFVKVLPLDAVWKPLRGDRAIL